MDGSTSLDRHATFDGALALARREVFVLAVAVQSGDREVEVISAARLRSALSIAQVSANGDGASRLAAVEQFSERWLWKTDRGPMTPMTADRLLGRLGHVFEDRDRAIDATAMTLDDFDLDDLQLRGLSVRRGEMTRVTTSRARLEHFDAIGATIIHCRFEAASLVLASLDEIAMEDCDLTRANLERAGLHRARIARCRFTGSVLFEARLNHAVFTDCDFRGADFGARVDSDMFAMADVRFVNCDMRESNWRNRCLHRASFIDCKLYGVQGAPHLQGVVIDHPDLSREADGSKIGTRDDIALGWPTLVGNSRA